MQDRTPPTEPLPLRSHELVLDDADTRRKIERKIAFYCAGPEARAALLRQWTAEIERPDKAKRHRLDTPFLRGEKAAAEIPLCKIFLGPENDRDSDDRGGAA